MASRLDATGRIQRLLAILQWASTFGDEGVAISELCHRFGLTEGQLIKELEMASMIGADTINYDEMPFEVVIWPDHVVVRLFSFQRPLRLTPAEGLALVAAADALLGDDRTDSPLARALVKLADLLRIEPGQTVDVNVEPEGGEVGRRLSEAVADRRRVRFRYWSYSRDEVATRLVEPWRVFEAEGSWYLAGFDVDVAEDRRFRLDRMEDPEVLDEPASPPPRGLDLTVGVGDDAPRAVLDLPAHAGWVAEAYPVEQAELTADGRLQITLQVAGRRWLERLLLRIGPEARVVRLDDELGDEAVLAGAARAVLARYRGGGGERPR